MGSYWTLSLVEIGADDATRGPPSQGPALPISQLAPRLSPQQWGLLFSGDQEATSGRILTRAAMGFLISFEVTRS